MLDVRLIVQILTETSTLTYNIVIGVDENQVKFGVSEYRESIDLQARVSGPRATVRRIITSPSHQFFLPFPLFIFIFFLHIYSSLNFLSFHNSFLYIPLKSFDRLDTKDLSTFPQFIQKHFSSLSSVYFFFFLSPLFIAFFHGFSWVCMLYIYVLYRCLPSYFVIWSLKHI